MATTEEKKKRVTYLIWWTHRKDPGIGLLQKQRVRVLVPFMDVVLGYASTKATTWMISSYHRETHREKLSINSPKKNRNAITITSIFTRPKGLCIRWWLFSLPIGLWSRSGQARFAVEPPARGITSILNLPAAGNHEQAPGRNALQPQYQTELEKNLCRKPWNMLYAGFTRLPRTAPLLPRRKTSTNDQKNNKYLLYQYLQHHEIYGRKTSFVTKLAQGVATQKSSTPVAEQVFHHVCLFNWIAVLLKLKTTRQQRFRFFETQQGIPPPEPALCASRTLPPPTNSICAEATGKRRHFQQQRNPGTATPLKIIHHPEIKRYFGKDILIERKRDLKRVTIYKPDRIVFDGD